MSRLVKCLILIVLLPALLTGCWSSKEIEDLALYAGLALDVGQPAPVEKEFEAKGARYSKRNKVMATIQIVPTKSAGGEDKKKSDTKKHYLNTSASGDSILEIFRQFSIRRDRPIIGHHLKVIVICAELLKVQAIEQLMDFVLRDNDIRPSTLVFISRGPAKDTLYSSQPNEIPSFHISGMLRNRSRTSKVINAVTLSRLDALMYAKKSFVLQNLVTAKGETEFSGVGIIKGSSGQWIGNLNQEDTEGLAWIKNEGHAGVIKTYDRDNEPITYEIKAMKSKIKADVSGNKIAFHVSIKTEGRLIEIWNSRGQYTQKESNVKDVEELFKAKLKNIINTLMRKLQTDYKTDVAGFGEVLSIKHPHIWKKVKEEWDDIFSKTEITFDYKLSITEFGSFTND
ncbi:Ger(x)C family spore germination protein [Paenibacillus sp. CAU 1782]